MIRPDGEAELWVSDNPRWGVVRAVVVSGDYAAVFDDLNGDYREVELSLFRRDRDGWEGILSSQARVPGVDCDCAAYGWRWDGGRCAVAYAVGRASPDARVRPPMLVEEGILVCDADGWWLYVDETTSDADEVFTSWRYTCWDSLDVRAATAADVVPLIEFWAWAGENRSRPTDRPDLVARLIERDAESVIIAELDGRIIGTVVAGWDGWRAHLYRLAVDPDERGQGFGRRLLAAAEKRLTALGAERLDAMVLDDNEAGRALWASAGFERQDDWARWVKPLV